MTFDEPMRGEDGLARNQFGVVQAACVHCGECDIGCNVGAKNTLDSTTSPWQNATVRRSPP